MQRELGVVDQLRDPEVEQLGQQAAGALDHHDIRRLHIAVHDPPVVGRLDDLGDPLEERHELLERQGPAFPQPAMQGDALHHFHRDPEQAIVVLDPEGVHVRGVGMIEPRREPGFAHEALQNHIVTTQSSMQHLDHGFSPEEQLLAAVHRAKSTLVDPLADEELAHGSPAEILALPHHFYTYTG